MDEQRDLVGLIVNRVEAKEMGSVVSNILTKKPYISFAFMMILTGHKLEKDVEISEACLKTLTTEDLVILATNQPESVIGQKEFKSNGAIKANMDRVLRRVQVEGFGHE
jgi:hypothetical protein